MAVLPINQLVRTGLDPGSYLAAASAGGDKFPASPGRDFIHVRTGATGITMTIEAVPDVAVVLATNKDFFIRVTRKMVDKDGFVNLSYTAVTNVTVGVVRM